MFQNPLYEISADMRVISVFKKLIIHAALCLHYNPKRPTLALANVDDAMPIPEYPYRTIPTGK